MNALRIKENEGDLLHAATVCTDLTNPVTRRYLGKGSSGFKFLGHYHTSSNHEMRKTFNSWQTFRFFVLIQK